MSEEERLKLLRLRKKRAEAEAEAEARAGSQVEQPTPAPTDGSYAQDVLNAVTALPRGAATVASGAVRDIGKLVGSEWLYDKGDASKQYFLDDEAERQKNMKSLPLTVATSMLTGGGAAKGLQAATTVGGKIMQGGGLGVLFGGAQPSKDEDQQVMNAGLGAAFGAGLPAASKMISTGYNGVKNLVEPWLKGGTENMAARALKEAAGIDKNKIISLLDENKQLPNGGAGAGEVSAPSGNAVFPAVQRRAETALPTPYTKAAADDNVARVEVLRNVGGTADELDTLIASNKAQGAINYPEAFSVPVTPDAALNKIFKNPFVRKAINSVSNIAEHKKLTKNNTHNKSVQPENLTEYIHQLKVSMDESLQKNAESAAAGFEQRAVIEARNELLEWLANKNPLYAKARDVFGSNMKEIDKRKVMQGLEDKLVPPKNDMAGKVEEIYNPQSVGSFGSALRNEHSLIRTSTGNPRSQTLRGVVGDEGVEAADQVAESLSRRAGYEELGKRGSTAAGKVLGAMAPNPPSSGMITQKYSLFKVIASALQGKVRGESLELLNQAMLEPARAAELLRRVVPDDQPLIFRAMTDLKNGTIAGQTALTNN